MSNYGELKGRSLSSAVGALTTYSTVSSLPSSGNEDGDLTFVTENNRLYIWNDTGWYSIALLNLSPTAISGNSANYLFETDGTPLVVTLESTDPEGFDLTWSHSITSGTLGSIATIEQVDNVFTVTPSTDQADEGIFSITFSATEGINVVTSIASEFTLSFYTAPVLTVSPAINSVSTFDIDSVDIVNFVAGTEYTVTNNTLIDIDMLICIYGGKGGGPSTWGGQGGKSEGEFTLTAGESVFVIAGTQGGLDAGSPYTDFGGSGGGGSGVYDSSNTYLVAGGGGGSGGACLHWDGTIVQGGAGGGTTGGNGATINAQGGFGGSQTAVGAGGAGSRGNGSPGSGHDGGDGGSLSYTATAGTGFGTGGLGGLKGGDGHAGGGGAGWYGGGGGGSGSWGSAGGGGSGYVNTTYITNGSTTANQNSGDGYITITKVQ